MQNEEKTQAPELVPQDAPAAALPAPVVQHQIAVPTTPMDLLRIVTQRGASPEEIAKFMDLMERQQDRDAQQAFVRAMASFKKNAPTIVKDAGANFTGKNRDTGEKSAVSYDYATLGHICENIIGALAEHGISHDWDIQQPSNSMIVVKCTLTHEQGGSKSTTIQFPPDPSGTKNGLQAIGSAITYGQRYSLLAVCGIAVKQQGDDDGRAAGAPIFEQAKESGQQDKAPGRVIDRSTNQDTRQAIEGQDLARAIAAIKTGRYSWAKLNELYVLTQAQATLAKKELGIEDAQK